MPDAQPERRPSLLVTLLATSLGAGFMPKAPGHTGTLTAVPLAWVLGRAGVAAYALGTLAVTVIGTWAAREWVRATGREDDQRIVIDEVAGYLVTLSLVPRSAGNLIAGFLLFRLFDVWKPGPIGMIDRRVHGGFGVMADDLAAGAVAALCLLGLHRFGIIAAVAEWIRT